MVIAGLTFWPSSLACSVGCSKIACINNCLQDKQRRVCYRNKWQELFRVVNREQAKEQQPKIGKGRFEFAIVGKFSTLRSIRQGEHSSRRVIREIMRHYISKKGYRAESGFTLNRGHHFFTAG
ncbi:unnamed protein product [Lepidochelys olivacea]